MKKLIMVYVVKAKDFNLQKCIIKSEVKKDAKK